jgi:hypothetical protein
MISNTNGLIELRYKLDHDLEDIDGSWCDYKHSFWWFHGDAKILYHTRESKTVYNEMPAGWTRDTSIIIGPETTDEGCYLLLRLLTFKEIKNAHSN